MMEKQKRFVKIYAQGGLSTAFQIWVDTKTGVNYVVSQNGYGGGMTALLDRDGKPVISKLPLEED